MIKYSDFLGCYVVIYKEPKQTHSTISHFPTLAMANGFLASKGIQLSESDKKFWWNKD